MNKSEAWDLSKEKKNVLNVVGYYLKALMNSKIYL